MRNYGHKNTAYGYAEHPIKNKRQENFYDALNRSGRKHARQVGKKACKEIE